MTPNHSKYPILYIWRCLVETVDSLCIDNVVEMSCTHVVETSVDQWDHHCFKCVNWLCDISICFGMSVRQMKVGQANFTDFVLTLVTTATSLKWSGKGLFIYNQCLPFAKILVKIGKVDPEIIGLQESIQDFNIGIAYGPKAGMPGWLNKRT